MSESEILFGEDDAPEVAHTDNGPGQLFGGCMHFICVPGEAERLKPFLLPYALPSAILNPAVKSGALKMNLIDLRQIQEGFYIVEPDDALMLAMRFSSVCRQALGGRNDDLFFCSLVESVENPETQMLEVTVVPVSVMEAQRAAASAGPDPNQ